MVCVWAQKEKLGLFRIFRVSFVWCAGRTVQLQNHYQEARGETGLVVARNATPG